MVTVEILSLLFVLLVNTVVFWVIVSQSWRVVTNRYFAVAVLFVIIWTVGTLMLLAKDTYDIGRVIYLVSSMYLILFLSFFAALFPMNRGKILTTPNKFLLVLTVVFSVIIAIYPSLLLENRPQDHMASYALVANQFGYIFYLVYFCIAFTIAFSALFMHIKKSKGHERKQLKLIFGGTFTAALFSLVTNLIMPVMGNADYLWLGPVWTLFYVVMVGIAIVRHKLFDVKLAVVRTIAYLSVLATLSLVYYVAAYFLSLLIMNLQTDEWVSFSPVNILLALALTFLFQPVKRFFDKVTDRIFYKDNYRSEDFYTELNEVLTSTTDLRGLLTRVATVVGRTFKAEQVSFFVHYTNDQQYYMSAGTSKYSKLPASDAALLREYVNAKEKNGVILFTESVTDESIRRMLISHGVAMFMPLARQAVISGFLLLGEHRSGSYTARDINVLTAIRSELIIAIQNAQSLQEVKELNATLQQRIDVATNELRASNAQLKHIDEVKDEFMSMASHQLRTPLTSIKGYLSMVLDGDMGKITAQQQKVLQEAFNSSERMVHLIADFLNVSRLQTGKFVIEKGVVDINALVQQEVDDLQVMAKGHKLELLLKIPKTKFLINADAAKLREVITNFIDNAIFYSRPVSKIIVKVKQDGEWLQFTVTDTGIGVPKSEQAKLFSKFYRATNARKQRPDGTGVGLYLAHKVIAAHGGKMIFESVEGKGSVFGFRIPLAKLPNKANDSDYHDHDKKYDSGGDK